MRHTKLDILHCCLDLSLGLHSGLLSEDKHPVVVGQEVVGVLVWQHVNITHVDQAEFLQQLVVGTYSTGYTSCIALGAHNDCLCVCVVGILRSVSVFVSESAYADTRLDQGNGREGTEVL